MPERLFIVLLCFLGYVAVGLVVGAVLQAFLPAEERKKYVVLAAVCWPATLMACAIIGILYLFSFYAKIWWLLLHWTERFWRGN